MYDSAKSFMKREKYYLAIIPCPCVAEWTISNQAETVDDIDRVVYFDVNPDHTS